MREQFSCETFSRMKTCVASCGATMHDLLLAAYGTALRDWVSEQGTLLEVVPLCSTADLRRYFPAESRSHPMNYTVAYWSPVRCGKNILETPAHIVRMSHEIKQHAIEIGAAEPFTGTALTDEDISRFAGVPFLTNTGTVPAGMVDFGEKFALKNSGFR